MKNDYANFGIDLLKNPLLHEDEHCELHLDERLGASAENADALLDVHVKHTVGSVQKDFFEPPEKEHRPEEERKPRNKPLHPFLDADPQLCANCTHVSLHGGQLHVAVDYVNEHEHGDNDGEQTEKAADGADGCPVRVSGGDEFGDFSRVDGQGHGRTVDAHEGEDGQAVGQRCFSVGYENKGGRP